MDFLGATHESSKTDFTVHIGHPSTSREGNPLQGTLLAYFQAMRSTVIKTAGRITDIASSL